MEQGLDLRNIGLLQLRARRALLPSMGPLVLANLVPLVGVLFFGWRAFDVALTFWLESLVIGVFTVLKIRRMEKAGKHPPMPALFFLIHYGMFTVGMFISIVGCFGPAGFRREIGGEPLERTFRYILSDGGAGFAASLISFVMSHYYSFKHNFLAKQEYVIDATVKRVILTPYLRLILTIATVIFAAATLENGLLPEIASALFLIAIKTMTDLFSHQREHRNSGGRPAGKR